MTKLLGDIPFRDILPSSIKDDPKVMAAAEALEGLLLKTSTAAPNLLIWARLNRGEAQIIPPLARLAEKVGGLKAHSSSGLELLAWHLHVDFREVAADDEALERTISQSIPWHRIKGTPAAVEEALGLFGISAITDESGTGRNWAVYELEMKDAPTTQELLNIVRVAEEAGPKRSWLRRLHNGYDHRPIVLDVGPPLDDGFLDDDSGVWADGGIKESFGSSRALAAEVFFKNAFGAIGQAQLMPALIHCLGRPVLDQWALDSPIIRSLGVAGLSLMGLRSHSIEGRRRRWVGPWDKHKWNEAGIILPRRRLDRRREVSKSQLALDWGRLDNSLERLDRPWGLVMQPPLRLDQDRLDWTDADQGQGMAIFDELFFNRRCLASHPAEIKSTHGFHIIHSGESA